MVEVAKAGVAMASVAKFGATMAEAAYAGVAMAAVAKGWEIDALITVKIYDMPVVSFRPHGASRVWPNLDDSVGSHVVLVDVYERPKASIDLN